MLLVVASHPKCPYKASVSKDRTGGGGVWPELARGGFSAMVKSSQLNLHIWSILSLFNGFMANKILCNVNDTKTAARKMSNYSLA